MKMKNGLLSVVLGFIACSGVVQANNSSPLVFSSLPDIPTSFQVSDEHFCYQYEIKNTTKETVPLLVALHPSTDTRISINGNACMLPENLCNDQLKGGKSCAIVLEITPSTSGLANETLTIEYSPRYSALESDIIFEVATPAPAVLTFSVLPNIPPQIVPGMMQTLSYTVKNVGQEQAINMMATLTGSNLVMFSPGTCVVNTPLQPGATCTYGVTIFTTVSTVPGTYDNTLTIDYSDASGDTTAPLISNIDFAVIEQEPMLVFSVIPDISSNIPQGTTIAPFTYIIENIGAGNAEIEQATVSPNAESLVQLVEDSDNCSNTTLEPDTTCTMTYEIVTLNDTPIGQYNNTLSIPYVDALSPLQTSIDFYVSTATAPLLQLTAPTLPETVTVNSLQFPFEYTLVNMGGETATNINVNIVPFDYGIVNLYETTCGEGTLPLAPFDLDPTESCTLDYYISPENIGESTQTLLVTYDSADNPELSVSSNIDFTVISDTTPTNAYVANLGNSGSNLVTQCTIDYSIVPGQLYQCVDSTVNNPQNPNSVNIGPDYLYVTSPDSDELYSCPFSDLGFCNSIYGFPYSIILSEFYTTSTDVFAYFVVNRLNQQLRLCTSLSDPQCIGTGPEFYQPLAITFANINGNGYVYVLDLAYNSSDYSLLYQCSVAQVNGEISDCHVIVPQVYTEGYESALAVISAGEIYIYISSKVSNVKSLIACGLDNDGSIGVGCSIAENDFAVSVSGLLAAMNGTQPLLYSTLGSANEVLLCTVGFNPLLACDVTGAGMVGFSSPSGIVLY